MKRTLKSTTLKMVNKRMKNEPDFKEFIENSPILANTIKNVKKELQQNANKTIALNEKSMKYVLKRYAHIQLIQCILKLLDNDDCYIEFTFPYKHLKLSVWTEKEQHHKVYTISIEKRNQPWKDFVFWKKKDATEFFIDIFGKKMPKYVSVYRSSSLSLFDRPLHEFIRAVYDLYDIKHLNKSLIKTYNERIANIAHDIISPVSL